MRYGRKRIRGEVPVLQRSPVGNGPLSREAVHHLEDRVHHPRPRTAFRIHRGEGAVDDVGSELENGLFLGPADLALSFGTPLGDVRDKSLREATRLVVNAAQANGLTAVMYRGTLEAAQVAKEDGFNVHRSR